MGIRSHLLVADESFALDLLDDQQAGQLRRIIDLSDRLPDDWSGMMGRSTLQEDFGALRFQLAYMAYALALTHVHRMPAAPARFQGPFERLVTKLLSPDVWTYWRHVSTGNGPLNSAQGELPAQWNPVETDNIMYSAYVQSTALLYHYLFNSSKFAEESALSFRLRPLFWGGTGQNFAYDERSLNDHIYWTMISKGYLGIACEPNCVFQICNQVPILGFRLHDLVYGGDMASEVTQGYVKAWAEFGMVDPKGHYRTVVQEQEHAAVDLPPQPWSDFWMGALTHAWNPDQAKERYDQQIQHWLKQGPDGTLWVEPSVHPVEFGPELTNAMDFGWAAVCASEMGDTKTLEGLLAYADRFLNPVSEKGAYYYARRDQWFDDNGRLAAMDPHTGNALLAYARLNVPGGLRALYEGPWDKTHFAEPALVEMPGRLDLRGARYDAARRQLSIAWRDEKDGGTPVKLGFGNIWGRGDWMLTINGAPFASGSDQDVNTERCCARRQGDLLIVEVPVEEVMTLGITWH